MPAQSAQALDEWLSGANVIALARELGTPITLWHVTDGGYASVQQLERAVERYGDSVSHVVVKNLARAKDFSQLEASSALSKLRALGGKVIELPELDGPAMYRIDGSGASFWAGGNLGEGEKALKPLDRERVKMWLSRAYAELDKLDGAL
jgi:hypothetical protein